MSLEDCVDKFRDAGKKKPRQIQSYDFPPYKLHLEQRDHETYSFQMTVGGQIKLYSSTFIQVQAVGQLSTVDEGNTSISYEKKVLWRVPLLFYGCGLALIIYIFLSTENLFITLIAIIVFVANAGWEAYNARNYLDETPTLIELILAS